MEKEEEDDDNDNDEGKAATNKKQHKKCESLE